MQTWNKKLWSQKEPKKSKLQKKAGTEDQKYGLGGPDMNAQKLTDQVKQPRNRNNSELRDHKRYRESKVKERIGTWMEISLTKQVMKNYKAYHSMTENEK